MALIPSWFSASTKAIAEKALERGILKYPGMCFIQDTKSLAWVTQDNKIQYIKGTDQILNLLEQILCSILTELFFIHLI